MNIDLAVIGTCVGNVAVIWQSELSVGRFLACEDVNAGILAARLNDRVCDRAAPEFWNILNDDIVLVLVARKERENVPIEFMLAIAMSK